MGKHYYYRNQRINYWQFLLLVVFCLMLSDNIEYYKRYMMLNLLKKSLENQKNIKKESAKKEKSRKNLEVKRKGYISGEHKEGLIVADEKKNIAHDFPNHISKFKGETVTIFVSAGGRASEGFTGVFLNSNNDFVTLISIISSSEKCIKDSLGSIVDIPIDKIVAFVHNTV